MKPIGFQHPTIKNGITEMDLMPTGKYFYEHYIYPARPVVLRGVLNATNVNK